VNFIEVGTKSFVQEKTLRIPGDKFKVPIAKTLLISSSEKKGNS